MTDHYGHKPARLVQVSQADFAWLKKQSAVTGKTMKRLLHEALVVSQGRVVMERVEVGQN